MKNSIRLVAGLFLALALSSAAHADPIDNVLVETFGNNGEWLHVRGDTMAPVGSMIEMIAVNDSLQVVTSGTSPVYAAGTFSMIVPTNGATWVIIRRVGSGPGWDWFGEVE